MSSAMDIPVLLLAFLLVSGCSSEPVGPGPGIQAHSLVPYDSIGIRSGDPDYVFGMPRAVEFTTAGNIVVGDIATMKLMMYSPEGVFMRSGGARGEGPGEFAAPAGVSPAPGGGVMVSDVMGGKIIIYDSLLECAREISGFSPYPPERPLMLDDGSLVGTRPVFHRDAGTMVTSLARWEPGQVEPSLVYMERFSEFDQEDPRRVFRETGIIYCAQPDGKVLCSPLSTERYEITCFSAAGELLWEISPPFERHMRSQGDMDMELEMMRAAIQRNGGDPSVADRMPVNRWASAVTGMYSQIDRIWIRRGGELEPLFDVFSPEGEFMYSCRVPSLPYGSGVGFAISPCSSTILAYLADPRDYSRIWMLRDPGTETGEGLSLASPGMTSCTLSVRDGTVPFEVSLYWVGPPETPEGLRMAHTVTVSPLGSDEITEFRGLEAYYHSSSVTAGYLVGEDMNFDGWNDFRLMRWPSAGPNTYWYFWLFEPETGNFGRAEAWEDAELVSPSFDTEEEMIVSFHRDGMGMYGTDYYTVLDDVPVLVRSENTEYLSRDSSVTTVTELVEGEMMVTGRTIGGPE
jgi:hypothetical protein